MQLLDRANEGGAVMSAKTGQQRGFPQHEILRREVGGGSLSRVGWGAFSEWSFDGPTCMSNWGDLILGRELCKEGNRGRVGGCMQPHDFPGLSHFRIREWKCSNLATADHKTMRWHGGHAKHSTIFLAPAPAPAPGEGTPNSVPSALLALLVLSPAPVLTCLQPGEEALGWLSISALVWSPCFRARAGPGVPATSESGHL
jgi:hypothetical protein